MHIIIGLITAIAGLIWALNSLQNSGFDINSLNPFAWARRRKWRKTLGVKPMHALTNTMDAAALLVVAMAKVDGDITRDSKMEILGLFEQEFGVKRSQSIELFSASTYMLGDVMDMAAEVRHVLAPTKDKFEPSHTQKLLTMLKQVGSLENEPSAKQRAIIDAVTKVFNLDKPQAENW